MKFTVNSGALNEALQSLKVASGSVDPMLRVVLVEADDAGSLRLTATDTTLQITASISAQVEEPGRITIDLGDLSSATRNLPKSAGLKVSVSDGKLHAAANRSRFEFGVLDAANFPTWAKDCDLHDVAIPGDVLAKLLDSVSHAVATDDARPSLTGILLTNHGGETPLRAVATDGHRLAYFEAPGVEIQLPADGVTIPRRTAKEISRLAKGRGMVGLAITATTIRVDAQHEIILSKLIDGIYPDYQRVTALQHRSWAEVDRRSLLDGVQRAGAILDRSSGLKMTFHDTVELVGKREEALAVETIDVLNGERAEAVSLGLAPGYLLDALRAMTSDKIRVEYTNDQTPVKLSGPRDQDLHLILMTRRV